MDCRNHPTKNAGNTCSHCGDWLCEECTADVGGRIYCATCLQKHWIGHEAAPKTPPPPYSAPRDGRRKIDGGLLMFFTLFPPGINYMYEGLIKRGLFFLSAFCLSFYLLVTLNSPVFLLLMFVMWITCAFDAFRIRTKLNAGEYVPDNVDDILGFVRKHKAVIIPIVAIAFGFNLFASISRGMCFIPMSHSGMRHVFNNRLIPMLLFLGGLYLIISSGKRSKSSSADERRDFEDNNH